jgi:hypothetical protein
MEVKSKQKVEPTEALLREYKLYLRQDFGEHFTKSPTHQITK